MTTILTLAFIVIELGEPSIGFRRVIGSYFCFKWIKMAAPCRILQWGMGKSRKTPHKRLLKNSGKRRRSPQLGSSSVDNRKQLDSGSILKVKIKVFFVDALDGGLKDSKELKTALRSGG